MFQEEQQVQVKRRQSERAVQLAMANRWEDAVTANRAILDVFPNDTDSYNRLGKALMELKRYPAAKKAYKKALGLDETNQIASKNLVRITALAKAGAVESKAAKADPALYIEEMGKTALTTLPAVDPDVLIKLTAGDSLELKKKRSELIVQTAGGDAIGSIEPKLRSRMLKLLDGGSEYAAAITSLDGGACRIIIKETLRDPSQAGPSFATAIATEKVRAYTKDSLIQRGTKDEEAAKARGTERSEEDAEGEDWEDESIAQEGTVSISAALKAEEAEDTEELEE
ncbi:MAG: tetratricopeptide repeat protein [Chloroflexi bacterium]|nr:tetratricopeptide repeat protein [Chloroflexota bacterium]